MNDLKKEENKPGRRIIYFVNPISGTKGKESLRAFIEERNIQQGMPFEILPTVASGNYDFAAKKIAEEGITDVIICGGDGSVNQVVYALSHTGVNFGIIPMGSGNGLALAAGIPRDSGKAMDIVFSGRPLLVDAFMVNNQFACMLCGLGLDARVAHEFAQQPKRGLATYASLTTKYFLSATAYSFLIQANKLEFTVEAFFISIANSNQFGNNFTIAPQAILSDGLLDVVIVKKIAKPLLLWTVLRQVLAGKLQRIENSLRSPVIYFQTSELLIRNLQEAPMHIDGEPRETIKQLKIKILPGYFKLIHAT